MAVGYREGGGRGVFYCSSFDSVSYFWEGVGSVQFKVKVGLIVEVIEEKIVEVLHSSLFLEVSILPYISGNIHPAALQMLPA